jgi:hypothetical protein
MYLTATKNPNLTDTGFGRTVLDIRCRLMENQPCQLLCDAGDGTGKTIKISLMNYDTEHLLEKQLPVIEAWLPFFVLVS